MIDFFTRLPAWALDHPWALAGWVVLMLALLTAGIFINPDGVQLREKLRRKR